MQKRNNNSSNESISKFKLLSSYGGPGSIIHTEYGSIIVSCIEEWGFIQSMTKYIAEASKLGKDELQHIQEQNLINDLALSNDARLLQSLKKLKNIENLRYLALIPDIEIKENFNVIKKSKSQFAINSTFMPKVFYDSNNNYLSYNEWYRLWNSEDIKTFFPPKVRIKNKESFFDINLVQDNLVLICPHGHISDFPWSKFLRWRKENPFEIYNPVDLLGAQSCCNSPKIQINESNANSSGFDGKWIKCNSCSIGGTSLKGVMSIKIKCAGHRPWEVSTGDQSSYFGNNSVRGKDPLNETCGSPHMRVALTTGNNLYFSRIRSSIYMPDKLFLDENTLEIIKLKQDLEIFKASNDFEQCVITNNRIKEIQQNIPQELEDVKSVEDDETIYRFQEFKALTNCNENEIDDKDLKIKDVSNNLTNEIRKYFSRVLRIDNLKVTSAQLDFSRVEPDSSESDKIKSKNIFRSKNENVLIYPVVENYGEGIFFAFNETLIDSFNCDFSRFESMINKERNDYAFSATKYAIEKNWQLYLVHTFCHLIMREMEFRCGYPTASLSERIYVSNSEETKMYGLMIYTSEGAEGSMGGLIAQSRKENINNLILSALKRATVCNSDPLCWESDGQGLFELNLASCFSCSLVSETSCEHRNIYLDRQILVNEDLGFFKNLLDVN
ncbi:hypothetical protein B0A80_20445 [Flavobacterium tructae]|uniref:DUF1998 domain-containing protein n=1 Tax=Flavobacterium tructae TaxID=1114873 RepID=UPI000B5B8C13|nr:DUF1998 domain-containing protein [Flavobacterium tructae]OXB18442.1 hypothetical protein B0A80_20445 [Flavobacterium tructae]